MYVNKCSPCSGVRTTLKAHPAIYLIKKGNDLKLDTFHLSECGLLTSQSYQKVVRQYEATKSTIARREVLTSYQKLSN